MTSSVFALALEAGRRITAGRMHVCEGLRAVDDARRYLSNPVSSASILPAVQAALAGTRDALPPLPARPAFIQTDASDRLLPAGVFTVGTENALVHGKHSNMETVS